MPNINKKFVVSVADAYALDPVTKAGLWAGYANITSALNIAMTATDVKGGKNNQLLYRYLHDRVVTAEITGATFSKEVLSMNVGSDFAKLSNANVFTTECVDVTVGKGTMTGTAIESDVNVFFDDGTVETVTLTEKAFTLTDVTYNGKVNVQYTSAIANVEQLVIDVTKVPKVVDLFLIGDIKDSDGVLVQQIIIEVPKFAVDGNYDISFASDGVAQEKLTGTALAVQGNTCASGNGYAWVTIKDMTANA